MVKVQRVLCVHRIFMLLKKSYIGRVRRPTSFMDQFVEKWNMSNENA